MAAGAVGARRTQVGRSAEHQQGKLTGGFMPWSGRRLAVIVTTLLALVTALAVVAKAEPPAQPGATNLLVYATARMQNGVTVSLGPAIQVGAVAYHAGDKIPVGPDAYLSLIDTTLGGGRGYCSGYWGERDIEFHFRAWSTNAADTYTSSQWYESTQIEAHGIHDVPNTDVDQYVYLVYDAACL
jgi:hypothetical protein